MTTTVQVSDNKIIINGQSLEELISQSVKAGAEMVLNMMKRDPLETVTVQELAIQYGCTTKTMMRRIAEANIRPVKTGKFKAVFRKDLEKIIKA